MHLAHKTQSTGQTVHLAAMNAAGAMRKDATLLVLAGTYGDGAAPASGNQFLARLPKLVGADHLAVLVFDDKSFPAYCAFADQCLTALAAGRAPLLDMA